MQDGGNVNSGFRSHLKINGTFTHGTDTTRIHFKSFSRPPRRHHASHHRARR